MLYSWYLKAASEALRRKWNCRSTGGGLPSNEITRRRTLLGVMLPPWVDAYLTIFCTCCVTGLSDQLP